eukprot:1017191-Amorphochlora_amoeboformis.AAC.1
MEKKQRERQRWREAWREAREFQRVSESFREVGSERSGCSGGGRKDGGDSEEGVEEEMRDIHRLRHS